MDFGVLLRNSRRAAGLSQEDAARQVGVTAATLNRWERGHHRPHRLQLLAARQCIEEAWRNAPEIDRRRQY